MRWKRGGIAKCESAAQIAPPLRGIQARLRLGVVNAAQKIVSARKG